MTTLGLELDLEVWLLIWVLVCQIRCSTESLEARMNLAWPQGFLLALYSGITPVIAEGTIWSDRDQTGGGGWTFAKQVLYLPLLLWSPIS